MSGTSPTTPPDQGTANAEQNNGSGATPSIPAPIQIPAPVEVSPPVIAPAAAQSSVSAVPPPVEPPPAKSAPPIAVPPPVEPPPAPKATQSKPSGGSSQPPSLVERMKGNPDGEGAQMSFMDHLLELRSRLWTSIIAIAVCMVLALVFYAEIFEFLRAPLDRVNAEYMAAPMAYENVLKKLDLPRETKVDAVIGKIKSLNHHSEEYMSVVAALKLPQNSTPEAIQAQVKDYAQKDADYEAAVKTFQLPERSHLLQITSINMLGTMMMVMWLGIGAGLVLSSPIVVYELWSFVSPGLRDREKRAIQPILFGGIFFFLGGCAINYYILFPVTLDFSVWLNLRLGVRPLYTVDDYMSLLLNMMWITGLICETPLVVGVLAKLSIVKPEYLTKYWRVCVLVSFVFGSVFSPGTDIMSMLVFSALLLGLYVVSIFMAWFFYPKQKTAA